MKRPAALLGPVVAAALAAAAPVHAAQISQDIRFTADDGVSLKTTLSGQAPLAPRPTVVEFSPYGDNSQTLDPGPAYNFLLVQIRGTGDSDGTFDALGPRTQQDVQEVLGWACRQPWSEGTLALNGFSASAITIYDSLHLALPCVRAAILKSGTWELYRDLLWPGGVSNAIPGLGVLGLIGAPATEQGLERLQRNPSSAPGVAVGLFEAGLDGGVLHPTLDSWWQERGFRGDVNHLPILMIDGFFDVESRGAFQAYQALRGDGAHLLVIGAHDGAPAGTDGGLGEARAWLDHYVRGIPNGVDAHPRVQLYLSDGSRESDLGGRFVRYDATDWPVPGTSWAPLALTPGHGLRLTRTRASAVQSYP
ncbi:MAG TPA: CocE/NonD family hydrolase, partial [Solirubrobacteraceae bacterium]|nr:CocE/NonD family hydrolase [Solirubrobacteraceae bacterium]